jgi:hypothetical protein
MELRLGLMTLLPFGIVISPTTLATEYNVAHNARLLIARLPEMARGG